MDELPSSGSALSRSSNGTESVGDSVASSAGSSSVRLSLEVDVIESFMPLE